MYWFLDVGTCPTYMFSFLAEVFVRIRANQCLRIVPFRGASKEKNLFFAFVRLVYEAYLSGGCQNEPTCFPVLTILVNTQY